LSLVVSGHDTSLDYAGRWLTRFLNKYLTKPNFIKNTLLVVLFDEDDHSDGNRIPTVFFGPDFLHTNVKIGGTFNHYSLTRLIEDNWNLGSLNRGDKTAHSFMSIFQQASAKKTTIVKALAGAYVNNYEAVQNKTSHRSTARASHSKHHAFVKFRVGAGDQDGKFELESATLRLYTENINATSGQIEVFPSHSGWTETKLHPKNRPAHQTVAVAHSNSAPLAGQWTEIEILDPKAAGIELDHAVSFELRYSERYVHWEYATRHSKHPPELKLHFKNSVAA
jgi:hypothetical protein